MELPATSGRRVSFDPLALGLLAVSLAANVYLGLQVSKDRGVPPPQGAATPAVGDTVGDFVARDLDGATRVFTSASARMNTVYYMFTPTCPWCARNLDNFKAVVAGAGERYRVVAVSLDPNVRGYLDAHDITFPVFVSPTRETAATYGLGSVPQTIIVSPEGQVLRHWKGAYGPGLLEEVAEVLSIRLPGLIEPAAGN